MSKVSRSEQEWRAILSPDEFEVARAGGTERAFTGRYWNTKTPGIYHCVCCGEALFDAATKYESGSGWPSFYAPLDEQALALREDHSHGMHRVEVRCGRCDGHLGHVFTDGPAPTGLRYCMNSLSLKLAPRESD
jgi:peptide-methionine (R)-S-oxide reductase